MNEAKKRILRRARRKKHVRKMVFGTPDRPRLTVFRSHKNMYAQIIDDEAGKTLVSASTQEKTLGEKLSGKTGNRSAAVAVGEAISAKAKDKGIDSVIFDRNGYLYHGQVRDLADAARKGGLKF